MFTEPSYIPPPVGEKDAMGVHMAYLRRDVDELKIMNAKQHGEVIEKFNEMKTVYPTRSEFHDAQKIVEDHEVRIRSIEKWIWKAVGIVAFVSIASGLIVQILFK